MWLLGNLKSHVWFAFCFSLDSADTCENREGSDVLGSFYLVLQIHASLVFTTAALAEALVSIQQTREPKHCRFNVSIEAPRKRLSCA
jgi:hypothetical protein